MMKFKKVLAMFLVSVLGFTVLAGCGDSGSETNKESGENVSEKKKIDIAYPNWVEGIAMTNLAKVILEEKMDYEVDISMADIGVIYTSLADGDKDFLLDAWLPTTHKNYVEKYEGKLEDISTSFDNSILGLAVPSYVEADSIEDLNKYKEDYDGKITGLDSGAGVMEITKDAIEEYDLDFELLTGSEPAMLASLSDAIDNKESIVFIGWKPHWKFAKWDLKFLEDPKKTYGEAESLHTLGRIGATEDYPEAVEFFKNFHFTDEELSDLIMKLEDGGDDKLESARKWMNDNEELVNSWLPTK